MAGWELLSFKWEVHITAQWSGKTFPTVGSDSWHLALRQFI
jgi:hypothetical protein